MPGVTQEELQDGGDEDVCVTRWRSRSSTIAARSTSRSRMLWAPSVSPHSAQPDPATWKSGIATMQTASSSSVPLVARRTAISRNRVRFVSITPLGIPVVPDV